MPANQAQSSTTCRATAGSRVGVSAGAEQDMAVLTLDDRGMVYSCNRAGEALFKYRLRELVCRHISILLPRLADLELMQNGQPNPRLRFLCHIGVQFRATTQNGGSFASELFFNCLDGKGNARSSLIVRPVKEAAGHDGRRASGS